MDNKELFTYKSEDYFRFRPSYPDAAVDFLYSQCPGGKVIDTGAGTGIFTKALQRRFQHITAVEPNAEMREKFQTFLPGIPCSAGSAEKSALPPCSADLITAAQAFHWFDEELFKAESVRILRPGGQVAIIWNSSLKNDFTEARDAVCRKLCPRFRSGHAGKRSPAEGDAFLRCSYFREVEFVSFPNPFEMNLETFEGNMRSRSYAPGPESAEFSIWAQELRAVFEKFSSKGTVTEPMETQIYLGKF